MSYHDVYTESGYLAYGRAEAAPDTEADRPARPRPAAARADRTDALSARAREAASGLAALIDGLWLRGALAGEPLDTKAALKLANDYIDQLLAPRV